jgi:glutamyl-Q tRNA(Asp) synthetase
MEDLDTPRCSQSAADTILHTLKVFGLNSDEPILYQSQRQEAYEAALDRLKNIGVVYPCCCTRREISDSALQGIEGHVYPGTCRNGIPAGREGRAYRVRTDNLPKPHLNDALQGPINQHLENEIGDFVVKRADGLFAYQLAVVVDDAFQGTTHVVRGSDLLASTPRQSHLQRLLGFNTPTYMHLPIAVNSQGEKLSKQTLAPAISDNNVSETLFQVLTFLRQQPPDSLRRNHVKEILDWAAINWQPNRLNGISYLQYNQ